MGFLVGIGGALTPTGSQNVSEPLAEQAPGRTEQASEGQREHRGGGRGQIAQDVERRFASLTLHEVSGRFLNDENQVNVSVLNSGTHYLRLRAEDLWSDPA